ncbi:MAG: LysM peptidoglycan-binding domain-containing protein [Chloroflexota bacterium]|nr:MAG: LysM peptidoglycan-binding domain-containing protein [Chloroflexota bacterium]
MSGQEHIRKPQEERLLTHKRVEIGWKPVGARFMAIVAIVGLGFVPVQSALVQPVSAGVQNNQPAAIASKGRLVLPPVDDRHRGVPKVELAPRLPQPSSPSDYERTDTVVHVVREGESISQLAEHHQVSMDSIRWANNLDSDVLQIGQELLIPPVSGVLQKVREGDTVRDIAAMYEVDVQSILDANQISDPDMIQTGTLLVVPDEQPRASDAPERMVTARGGNRNNDEASGSAGTSTYTMQSGDTLNAIADRFGITVSTIVNANSIPDPDRLTAGQELLIPSSSGILHAVQEGDSVAWIAARYGVAVQDIVSANKLSSPDVISPGSRILIPSLSAFPSSASPLPAEEPSSSSYTVQPGDTLLGIASSLGVGAEDIARANALTEPYFLRDGSVLQIPTPDLRQSESQRARVAAMDSGTKHTVVRGDTVYGLSVAGKVSPDAIITANGLQPPYVLQIGQDLVIPGAGGEVHAVQSSVAPRPAQRPSAPPAAPAPLAGQPRPAPQAAPEPQPAPAAQPEPAPQPQPAPQPEPAPAPEATSFGSRVVEVAMQFRGYRYRWGGTSPSTGFDCSGLVYYVYQQAGRPIPRVLEAQLAAGPRVSRDKLQPGDIVYFVNTYKAGLSHNGIYIGDGKFINANNENVGVIVNSLSEPYWGSRYYAANRP